MLGAIGVDSIDDLFEQIPDEVRMDRPLDLEDGLSEPEVFSRMAELAAANRDPDAEPCSWERACTTITCRPSSTRSQAGLSF